MQREKPLDCNGARPFIKVIVRGLVVVVFGLGHPCGCAVKNMGSEGDIMG